MAKKWYLDISRYSSVAEEFDRALNDLGEAMSAALAQPTKKNQAQLISAERALDVFRERLISVLQDLRVERNQRREVMAGRLAESRAA